uniref:Transporter n=1 Tax=Solanum tuberosum TaxID=4113 RepID=M1CJF9_SOLTU
MPILGWRWPLALSSIPSFVELLLFVFTVESPRYLCAIGRTSDACDILKKIAVVNKTQLPPGKLVSSQLIEELHSHGKNKISSVKSGFSSLLVLLSPALRKNTLLIWVVYIGTNSSYYAIILPTSLFSSDNANTC